MDWLLESQNLQIEPRLRVIHLFSFQNTKIFYLGIVEPHLLGFPPHRAIYKFYKQIAREFVDNFYMYMYTINTQYCLLGITNQKKDENVNLK